ncbi:DUF5612 domain-containing protein [Methanocaldococcus indicus]|uniref:DUF5612 domain-containing protein n=1 Tax=Methanocaldococcus indicus TaxID=213231 RepID=UPI003C6D52D6
MEIGLSVLAENKVGVLHKLTGVIAKLGGNILYTQQFITSENYGFIYMEVEDIDIEQLKKELDKCNYIKEYEIHNTLKKIFGKRIIIIGGGAQVAEVAKGAISEADRHNIRGERISVDTLPIVGEENIAEAVEAVLKLPRVGILVLAGSLMGGKITEAVRKVKSKGIPIISLKMFGSVPKEADLVVGDPIQAGVLAAMAIAKTAKFDINKVRGKVL